MAKMSSTRIKRFLMSAVCAVLCCLNAQVAVAATEVAIESGEWCSDYLSCWWYYWSWLDEDDRIANYYFYAQSNETVIIRLGHEEHYTYPNFVIYNPGADGNIATNSIATYTSIGNYEHYLPVTNSGWYTFVCSLPLPAITNVYTNLYTSYNCSMLRIPNIPLSYQDTDVGTLQAGDSKQGEINVSSDLDAGFFAVTNTPVTMQIRMGQINYQEVPNIQIYGPTGTRITNDFPTDYRSEITATLTNQGIYTVVCSEKYNAYGDYAVTMVQIPGGLAGSDPDIGPIISGETRPGVINLPGDLDMASFNAVTGDVVSITMRDVDLDLNPVLEFYGPTGQRLVRTTDVFETRAVISNYPITSNGIYSVICKDSQDRYNVRYTLEMNFMQGSPSLANIPDPPASISASQGAYSNRIDVIWNASSGAIGYDLWRSYNTNTAVQICTNLTVTSYSDYSVITGFSYFYKVKARNAYGTSSNFSPTVEGYCGTSVNTANRRVLLVGIDNYAYGPSPLNTCTNDACGMRNIFFLGDPSNSWASTNMTTYTDRQATKATIQNALNTIAAGSSAGDVVVYVHSSHGGRTSGANAMSYICTYDANYTSVELAADLAAFNSDTKVIIIIDACYSGGMYQFKDGKYPEWTFAEETMAHYLRIRAAQLKSRGLVAPKTLGNNIAFMTACNYDELSYCSDFYSRYIGYLIQGCNVQSVDTNNSGQLSFMELHDYAATKSAEETPTQHAQSFHSSVLDNTIARMLGTNAVVMSRIRYNDFDADGYSDLAVYNTTSGAWRIGSLHRWALLAWDVVWGGPGFIPINGDYDGDRATDLAVYNEAAGEWDIASLRRAAFIVSVLFGGPNLTPVAGDYNGDGIYDGALYQTPDGFWYIISSVGAPLVWGSSVAGLGFVPVSGDYDGDQISDLALYNLSQGYWYIVSMTANAIAWGTYWGVPYAVPVSGDYDGDGYSDLAIYQELTGLWYVWSLKKQAILINAIQFGGPGFLPVPGDYDGDGVCDLVVYQESTGNWYLRSASGVQTVIPFGGPGWIPVLPMWP